MFTPENFYPNPQNKPEASFPQELTPPDIDPDADGTLLYEYNPAWTPMLMAACDQLGLYSTYAGDHDAKITAVNRGQLLKWMLQHPVEVGERDMPAPYWDDEVDVDDEEPVLDQEWYGEITNPDAAPDELTFVENAVIWILAGFTAFVLLPSGPGAIAGGLFFRTVAVRFTLAFNRGDIREIFRVVIDAADYDTVDTDGLSPGDIIELTVDGLDDLETHDILIVTTNPT